MVPMSHINTITEHKNLLLIAHTVINQSNERQRFVQRVCDVIELMQLLRNHKHIYIIVNS